MQELLECQQRQEVDAITSAKMYKKILGTVIDGVPLTLETLAQKLGRPPRWFKELFKLLELPEEIQTKIQKFEMSRTEGLRIHKELKHRA